MENWKVMGVLAWFVAFCCCIHGLIVFVCFLFRFQRTIRLPEHNKDNHNNRQERRGSERCQIKPMNGHGAGNGVRCKGSKDIFQAQEADQSRMTDGLKRGNLND